MKCPYKDCWRVHYKDCPIHGLNPTIEGQKHADHLAHRLDPDYKLIQVKRILEEALREVERLLKI